MDSYFTGRELTRPYTSGLYKKDLSFDEMKNLNSQITEDEKGSLFAKYYYEPMAELQLQMKAAVKAGALKPEQMYMPPQAGPILQSGSKEYPLNGYGVLENGVGYASMVIHQDGITDEMIRNYRDNFAVSLDPKIRTLFYKTWFPGKHLIHFEDAIIEDFGWGFVLQDMDWDVYQMEKHLGLKMEEIPKNDPHCIAITGLGGECISLENPLDRTYTCMVQYIRETENGRDLCIHYWNGVKLSQDGSIEVCPNVAKAEMEKRMCNMMQHAMYETCNELKHIKEFWEETHKI